MTGGGGIDSKIKQTQKQKVVLPLEVTGHQKEIT